MRSDPFHPGRWPRPLRWAIPCLAILALAYAGAQILARRAARGELRAQIASALERRFGPVDLGTAVEVDALFRVRCGPVALPGLRPSDPPLVRIESIRIRPDLVEMVRTRRAAAASIRLSGVQIEIPDRPGALREALARLEPQKDAPQPPGSAPARAGGPTLRIRDLRIAFSLAGKRLTAGPLQATFSRARESGGGTAASADVRFPGSGQGTLFLRRDGEGWHATSRFERIERSAIPAELAGIAAGWTGGSLSASLSGDAAPGFARARARLELAAAGLQLGGASAEPIGPLDLRFTGELAWSAAEKRVRLAPGRLELPGGAAVALQSALELRKGLPFTLEALANGIDYLRAVSALPPALSLPPDSPHPTGSLDARAALSGPLLDPAAWRIDAALDLSRMREAARRAPPVALLGPFVLRVPPEQGPPRSLLVGPDDPSFVPLAELPRYVPRAVTASEDGGFFGHSGFDFDELRNAAVEGAQAGRVVRGGSTISQQLAKNLYLSREKTMVRKIREALITVALEATVPKQRLLEIYLNVAEWGPGVWGIGPAARHWFGKDARDLTPREAAFLATVIPNPVRYHYMWTRGSLSPAWEQRVDDLLRTMNGQGTLTEDELTAALGERIVFANPAAAGERPAGGLDEEGEPGDASAPWAHGGAGRRGRPAMGSR
jgi:penicillin-binding protein 1A